jgi:hypothetical protein
VRFVETELCGKVLGLDGADPADGIVVRVRHTGRREGQFVRLQSELRPLGTFVCAGIRPTGAVTAVNNYRKVILFGRKPISLATVLRTYIG